jgi:hypothetical protein
MNEDITKMINMVRNFKPTICENENTTDKWVTCPRCGGSGELPIFSHINAGKCYECGGKGVVLNTDVPGIIEKMKLAKEKKAEKNAEVARIAREKHMSDHERRVKFAREFNTKIIEKVIVPNTSIDNLIKRDDFLQLIRLSEHLNIKNGSEFLEMLKDYGGKFYLQPLFYNMLDKFLREKYGYSEYLKDKSDMENFFADFPNVSQEVDKTINALQAKYRDEYDKIGRYDDDFKN